MKFVDAVVLLGWYERDEAVEFLRKGCKFDPPLSQSKARKTWERYKKAVDDLGARNATAPPSIALTPSEQTAADALLNAYLGSTNIKGVVKIDPRGLVVHQPIVYTDHAKTNYGSCDMSSWIATALPLPKAAPNLKTLREGPNAIHLDVPHAEFGIQRDAATGLFRIDERARHVSVTKFSNRLILGAGYHRTYSCILNMSPVATDRSLAMVLTTDADFLVSAAAPNQGLRAILCGPRPPLFGDFFDDDLAIKVSLPKLRFELHVVAQLIGVPV